MIANAMDLSEVQGWDTTTTTTTTTPTNNQIDRDDDNTVKSLFIT